LLTVSGFAGLAAVEYVQSIFPGQMT